MQALVKARLYILCAGCVWQILPNDFPKWKTVYHYFRAWRKDRTWQMIHEGLRLWVHVISEQGGRLQNFGEDANGTIKTLDYLIDVVSTIIFTASAQHAAVNFPQGELITHAPAFPLASYSSRQYA